MLKFILVTVAVSSFLFGCSGDPKSSDDGGTPSAYGTRTYKLDPEAAAVQLSVYGVRMGTPDEAKFRFLMRALKNAGEFVQLIERAPGIEGGGTLCGVFAATANHGEIYDLIRSIATDSKNTNFTAASVASCAP